MITLLHPSRNRPDMAFETAKTWAAYAVNRKDIQYILSIDNDEPQMKKYQDNYYHLQNLFGMVNISVCNNKNIVQAMNAPIHLALGNIIVGMSDDFYPPQLWDQHLLARLDTEKEEALQVNDGRIGIEHTILTIPILTKKLLDKIGYIYCPEYTGWGADNDIAEMCNELGVLQKDYSITFEHRHWRNEKRKKDDTDNRHDSPEGARFGNDKLAERRLNNYGLQKLTS